MISFDQQKLIHALRQLPRTLRVAFAAACAERQLPAYQLFLRESRGEDKDALVRALDEVWLNPGQGKEMDLQRQLKECMGLIPREDVIEQWTEQASRAQDAGISVTYALRTRISGEAQDAAWSAQTAYESLDNFVVNRESIDTNQPGGEDRVLSHPLIQAELSRQKRDFDELRGAGDANHQLVIMQLRNRAKSDGRIFFTSTS